MTKMTKIAIRMPTERPEMGTFTVMQWNCGHNVDHHVKTIFKKMEGVKNNGQNHAETFIFVLLYILKCA